MLLYAVWRFYYPSGVGSSRRFVSQTTSSTLSVPWLFFDTDTTTSWWHAVKTEPLAQVEPKFQCSPSTNAKTNSHLSVECPRQAEPNKSTLLTSAKLKFQMPSPRVWLIHFLGMIFWHLCWYMQVVECGRARANNTNMMRNRPVINTQCRGGKQM